VTTRDHARRAIPDARGIRIGAAERDEALELGPSLPDRLAAARERKGVDLTRAERDTKIRVRYLSALERGDWRALPGSVYTKGFLRNYAIYLGLDPEDVLRQWRHERGDQASPEPLVVPPRPIAEPSRPLVFSPSIIVAALMTLGVVAFGVYLSVQLLRYAKPPVLAITNPAEAVIAVDETVTSYRLAGTATAGATITVSSPGRDQPYRASALADGTWSVSVELRRGKNQFDIAATDPETGKQAESPRTRVINVPFLAIQAPTLTVSQPVDGTTYENGAIPVEGMATNAKTVTVAAAYLGPVGAAATAPPAAPTLAPSASGGPGTSAPPEGTTVQVGEDGSFSTPLELTTGKWAITITATSDQGKTASLTRTVTVAYKGVNLVVSIKGGPAWLKVWIDGKLASSIPQSGQVFQAGKTLTFVGLHTIEVRTGSSGSTFFTLNGVSLGSLGKQGIPETWLFAPPSPPTKTQHF
jgi:cytoskeletal protein RodZ